MSTGIFSILLLLVVLGDAQAAPTVWFTPLSSQCRGDIDTIDHCCSCGPEGLFSERHDVTPVSAPLPLAGENLGTALRLTEDGRRVVADNFPDSEEDQRIDDNTLVHVVELEVASSSSSSSAVHELAHYTIGSDFEEEGYLGKTPLPSRGHTLAVSENLILLGCPSTYPATAALYVRTSNPPWSLSIFLREPSEDSEFGYAVAVDERTQFMAVSDPGRGRVYAYLTYADFIVDTIEHPEAGAPAGNRFGHAIVLQNQTMVVSSPLDSDGDGSIHVFDRSGTAWYHSQTLRAPLQRRGAAFGWRIAVDGEYLAVASKHSAAGAVEVYRRTRPLIASSSEASPPSQSSRWDHVQTLTAPGMTLVSRFGWGLDVARYEEGVRIAVGDPMFLASVSAHGKVFLYEYDGTEFVHCETFMDDKTSFHTRFGTTVSLSRTGMMAVGAPDTDSLDNGRGRVWLFDLRRQKQCAGCDGVVNSLAVDDGCGVCNGDGSTCSGCDGVPYSGKELDECGVCEGDNSACLRVTSVQGLSGMAEFTLNADDANEEEETVAISAASETNNALFTTTVFYELPRVCNRIETRLTMSHVPRQHPVRWSVLEEPSLADLELSGSAGGVRLNAALPLAQIRNSPKDDRFTLRVEDELSHVVEVHVSFTVHACVGCDGVLDSGTVEDDCGVCGGDGTTCHDCAGERGGGHAVDACGQCTLEHEANRTCLAVAPLGGQTIYCHQTLELREAPEFSPAYEGQQVRWHIVAEPTHGACSIGYRTGLLTYHHRGKENSHEEIVFAASDHYGNDAESTVVFHVVGCDVVGCDGVMGSGKTRDRCDVCGGGDECVDCNDEVHGFAVVDPCGVCGGDGSSCGEEDEVAAAAAEEDLIPVDGQEGAVAATVAGVPIVILVLVAAGITVVGVGFVWIVYAGRRDRREYQSPRSQWTETERWQYNSFGRGSRPVL